MTTFVLVIEISHGLLFMATQYLSHSSFVAVEETAASYIAAWKCAEYDHWLFLSMLIATGLS